MIEINRKKDCCGCAACAQSCPKGCITMQKDEEGFSYPYIDTDRCVNCGLCEKVCPVFHSKPSFSDQTNAYAAYNLDEEERLQSSSGGVFSLLAKQVLHENGVIYGAAMMDDCSAVRHIRVESQDELGALRGSKYLQSEMGQIYTRIKEDLNSGKKVLFSGTPCQAGGLRAFLGKDYENLLCVGVVCHGVPSQKLWLKYLRYREKRAGATAQRTLFRHKYYGWKMYAVRFEFSNHTAYKQILYKDLFLQMFLQNICLRPSCYECRFKEAGGLLDISLADFWGVEGICPDLDDDKGLSLIIVHTEKGIKAFQQIEAKVVSKKVDLKQAVSSNPAITKSCSKPDNREDFMNSLDCLTIKQLGRKFLKKKPITVRIRIWLSVNVKKRLRRMLKKGN